jgi:hypothetical protein
MSSVDDSTRFQFCRRLLVSVAFVRIGEAEDGEVRSIVDDVVQELALADEFNSQFRDRFSLWAESVSASDLSAEMLHRLADLLQDRAPAE